MKLDYSGLFILFNNNNNNNKLYLYCTSHHNSLVEQHQYKGNN